MTCSTSKKCRTGSKEGVERIYAALPGDDEEIIWSNDSAGYTQPHSGVQIAVLLDRLESMARDMERRADIRRSVAHLTCGLRAGVMP